MNILFIEIVISIILIFLIIKHNWVTKTIRDICKEPEGYIKLIQTAFFLFVAISFVVLLFYFIIKPGLTNKLYVFLTIIVGFLGTLIGYFFRESTMDIIRKEKQLIVAKKTKDFIKEIKKLNLD